LTGGEGEQGEDVSRSCLEFLNANLRLACSKEVVELDFRRPSPSYRSFEPDAAFSPVVGAEGEEDVGGERGRRGTARAENEKGSLPTRCDSNRRVVRGLEGSGKE
jgi:hypothetical protein